MSPKIRSHMTQNGYPLLYTDPASCNTSILSLENSCYWETLWELRADGSVVAIPLKRYEHVRRDPLQNIWQDSKINPYLLNDIANALNMRLCSKSLEMAYGRWHGVRQEEQVPISRVKELLAASQAQVGKDRIPESRVVVSITADLVHKLLSEYVYGQTGVLLEPADLSVEVKG